MGALLGSLLWTGGEVGAQDGEPPPYPQSEEGMIELGEARLDTLTAAIHSDPTDIALRLERVRTMYVLSVSDEPLIEEALLDLGTIATAEHSRERGYAAVADAYAAAFEVVRGKHAFWPRGKWNHVQDGLRVLDQLVRDHPAEPEIRYLRLVSCYYLPFFFSRGESVDADLEALLALLPEARGVLSDHAYRHVADFVIEAALDKGASESAVAALKSAVGRVRADERLPDPPDS